MKLVNAKLYEAEIRRKMWEVWYDEKYQYYFGGGERYDFSLGDGSGCPRRSFAVLNDRDELLGYIDYTFNSETRVAYNFGAINFSEDKLSFGKALRQVIEDCFLKFSLNVVDWIVVCGNPVERSYDRMCEKLGGRIVGVRRARVRDFAGNLHDNKEYEILREDFLRAQAVPESKEVDNDKT